MKKRVILGALITATLLVTARGNSEATTENESKGGSDALVVSAFGLGKGIIKKDTIIPFEKESEARVTLEVGDSASRSTRLKNNLSAGIDVIELAQTNATQGGKEELFEKITEKEIPSLDQLTSGTKEASESGADVSVAINGIRIVYDKERLSKETKNWDDLWSADLKDKISIPDVATTAGPLMLYATSEHVDQDIAKDSGRAAFEATKELKPNVAKTYSKSSDLANMFQSGEIEVVVVTDLAVNIIQGAAENVTYVIPKSGTYASYNTANIPRRAQNKETTFKFVSVRISGESQKARAISLNEGPINRQATLSEKKVKSKTYGTIIERAKTVGFNFINSQLADWTDQWNRTVNQ